jgi:ceramide glucosyltransferase
MVLQSVKDRQWNKQFLVGDGRRGALARRPGARVAFDSAHGSLDHHRDRRRADPRRDRSLSPSLDAGARRAPARTGHARSAGDSDTRPDRQVLRVLVERLLGTAGAGCAFAPVVVNGAPRAAGDVGYAMLINGWYGPSVAMCAERAGGVVPFIMGQLMVFRREALEAIGGVGCAKGQLVDDMAIGACVHKSGWRNIMIEHPLYIATGGMTMGGFVKLFRRWLLFSRNGLPTSFTWPMWMRGVEFWGATLAVLVGLFGGAPIAALVPALALVAFIASQLRVQQEFGGARVPLHWAWVPFAIPLVAPGIVVETTLRSQVDWRGRGYSLEATTVRLAVES